MLLISYKDISFIISLDIFMFSMIKSLLFGFLLALLVPLLGYAQTYPDGCTPGSNFSVTTGKSCLIYSPTYTVNPESFNVPLTLIQLQTIVQSQYLRIMDLEKEVRELQGVKGWYQEREDSTERAKEEAEREEKNKKNLPNNQTLPPGGCQGGVGLLGCGGGSASA